MGEDFRKRDYRKFKDGKARADTGQSRRITINRVLFADGIIREGHKVVRIPGTKEYVALPMRHTVRLSDVTMSAFIQLNDEYRVLNENGEEVKMKRGSDLMNHFDNRTNKKRKDREMKRKKERRKGDNAGDII